MNKDIVLAIDNGTQSVRAILFDLKGEIVAKEQIFIEPYFSDAPGWAEQHATVYWKALCDACNGLLSRDEINKERIAAVSLTSQRATVVNVDKNG
ncbi:MAG: FGGY family carbohydrate kinase, partial [Calditrichaceae bacterium]